VPIIAAIIITVDEHDNGAAASAWFVLRKDKSARVSHIRQLLIIYHNLVAGHDEHYSVSAINDR